MRFFILFLGVMLLFVNEGKATVWECYLKSSTGVLTKLIPNQRNQKLVGLSAQEDGQERCKDEFEQCKTSTCVAKPVPQKQR